MKRKTVLISIAMMLALNACSTAPEAANPSVRRLCYVDEAAWVQIPEPASAQAYRDAWPQGAGGDRYPEVKWPEDEFWFAKPDGAVRLCVGNPFYREERCGAGYTMDYALGESGLRASNFQEPICIL